MTNERKTENLVRDALRKLGYYSDAAHVLVEEQKSEIEAVRRLLRTASKTGKGGKGAPEFIVTDSANAGFVLVVECKADVKHHSSATLDQPVAFAVDGALHYAKALSKEYTVIALGVSGQTSSQLKVSAYLHTKGEQRPKLLKTKAGLAVELSYNVEVVVDAYEWANLCIEAFNQVVQSSLGMFCCRFAKLRMHRNGGVRLSHAVLLGLRKLRLIDFAFDYL